MDQSKEDTLKLQQQLQGHERMFAQVQKSIELNVKSLEQKLLQPLSLYFAELKHSFVVTDFSIEKLRINHATGRVQPCTLMLEASSSV